MRAKKHWLRSVALVMVVLVALYFAAIPLICVKIFEFGLSLGTPPTSLQSAAMHSLTPMTWLSKKLPIYDRYCESCVALTMGR